ncbi:MAG: ATP-dependent Clp protease ATP-binding subunit [Acidobacteriota bacterium]|nr:ATP-dependent Clp protease ATP-binding subunit [Acidobacteriota bacterium]
MFEKYNEKSRRALFFARYEASKLGSRIIESEHILLGILREGEESVIELLQRLQVKPEDLRREIEGERVFVERISSTAELPLSEESKKILAYASHEAESMVHAAVGSEHLLIGVMRVDGCLAQRVLVQNGLEVAAVREQVASIARERASRRGKQELPFLTEFGRDLTALAQQDQFDPLIGREQEVGREDVLVFIDEIHALVGAGSAEGSLDAANILKPALSRGDIACIGATTQREYRRHIEKDRSLLRRFQAIQIKPPSADETYDILLGLKERYQGFHKVAYDDAALRAAVAGSNRYITDRHQPDKSIDVIDEAGARVKLRRVRDTRQARRIEQEIREVVAEMKAAISDKDFDRAVRFREREIELREDLESIEQLHEQDVGDQVVTAQDVEEVIASWTGVPVAAVRGDEAKRLMRMEDVLRRRIVGQDRAIRSISRAIRRSRLGVSDPRRPVGSFVFLGPSGVGKTEVARRLAEFLFGSQTALMRFDMSEYMEKYSASKLIGSPPGYVGYEEGGQLTERVRRQPYSLILFDEIEKAHPDIMNLLLQILEEGSLTDAYGNHVDFRHALVLLTSNLGSKLVLKGGRVGFGGTSREEFGSEEDFGRIREEIEGELRRSFSPEFINRIDETIVFNPLGREELRAITCLLLSDVNETLADRGLAVEVSGEAREWLLEQAGIDPSTGARPLRRTIQRYVQDAVSDLLIQRTGDSVERIRVDLAQEELVLEVVQGTTARTVEEEPALAES